MKKKCKGNYRCNRYKGCGEIKPIYRYGLCNRCYAHWLYSDDELAIKERDKFTNKVHNKVKADTIKKLKKETTNWLQKLQTKVQEIVRLIDYGQPCTATGKNIKQAHGGHIFPKGGHPECRLNLHNIHIQSAYSNTYRNDDGLMQEGIERIYGKEYLLFVRGLKNNPVTKHTNDFYESVYKIACDISNELKKDLRIRNNVERLTLRNEINIKLGIYPREYCLFKK